MKVLYVIDSLKVGGAEKLLLPLAHVAPARAFTFDVLSLAPEVATQREVLDGVRAAGLNVTVLPTRGLKDPGTLRRLVTAIRASGPHVVHAHLEYSAVLAPMAARIARRPAVCTLHHVTPPDGRREALKERMAVMTAGRSRALIFVSSAAMEAFAERYRRNPNTWTVLRNGIDLSQFVAEDANFPPELDIPSDAPVAVLVGSMRGVKGHAETIRAWPEVSARVPGARLLFVGTGPEEPHLRALVEELGLSDLVTFAGTRTDVARIMRASSLVVLPSRGEALPTVLMEAAGCGRPVVATAVGGIPEVVRDRATGVLVPVGDARALASAVVDLFTDSDKRVRMGTAARLLAEERFSVEAWCDRLRSLYERVLTGSAVVDMPADCASRYGR